MPTPDFELSIDAWGRLVLRDADGRSHVGVEPVRAFPLTDVGHWVALVDEKGRELVMVEDLARLDPDVRNLLERELASREFVPVLRKIIRIVGDSTPCEWEAETDRGATKFTLDSVDQVRKLGPSRLLITDARGLRYQIPDPAALDPASRRLLARFL